jgi:hypothetical protein
MMFYDKPTIFSFRVLIGRNDETKKISCIVIGFPELKLEDYDFAGRETGEFVPYAAMKNFKDQLTEAVKKEFRYDNDAYIKGRIRNSLLLEVDDSLFNGFNEYKFDVISVKRQ